MALATEATYRACGIGTSDVEASGMVSVGRGKFYAINNMKGAATVVILETDDILPSPSGL